MLDWERAALHLGPSDTPRAVQHVAAKYNPGPTDSQTAWWVTALFAPEIWRRWRVGLEHGSLNLWSTEDVHLPTPYRMEMPARIQSQLAAGPYRPLAERWATAGACPVIVGREALGFLVRPGTGVDPTFCEVFAPTHLVTRLGIVAGTQLELDILPGTA